MVLLETLMAEPNPHSISRTPVRTKLRSLTGRFSDCRGKTAFPNAYVVKALSPHHRFVIALHSPDGVAETGLGYDYLGNWEERLGNRNVETDLLRAFLKEQGHDQNIIDRALYLIEREAGD